MAYLLDYGVNPGFHKPPDFLLLTTLSTLLLKILSSYCQNVAIKLLNSSAPRISMPEWMCIKYLFQSSVFRIGGPYGLPNRSPSIPALGVTVLVAKYCCPHRKLTGDFRVKVSHRELADTALGRALL